MLNTLFSAVFTAAAAPVILAVLAARLVLGWAKAPRRFAALLWWVVAFRLLCPAIPVAVPQPVLHAINAPAQAITSIVPTQRLPAVQEQTPQPSVPSAQPTPAPVSLRDVVPYVWLSGAAAMLLYSIFTFLSLRRRLIGAVHLEKNVYLADHIPTPFVLGLIRPRIYLPAHLDVPQRDLILCHERQHIRRLDHLLKALLFLGLSLRWYDPLVWLAFSLAGRDMEMSCDEAVVRQLGPQVRQPYAASLLALSAGRRFAPTPLAFGEGEPGGRIRNLASWKPAGRRTLLLAGLLTALVLVPCACQARPAGDYYSSVQEYAAQFMEKDVTFQPVGDHFEAVVTEGESLVLTQKAALDGLAPEGTLELWSLNHNFDHDPADQLLVSGYSRYFEIVTLTTDHGCQVLYSCTVNDLSQFYYLQAAPEDGLYDWYVKEYGLDLPLYVEDWADRYPQYRNKGNYPVHREIGDGWSVYRPVTSWVPMEDEVGWVSLYTGARLVVTHLDQFPDPIPQEENTVYSYYNAPDGGVWQVRAHWKDPNSFPNPTYPDIVIEEDVVKDMLGSFTLLDQ